MVPQLLGIKAKSDISLKFRIQIELGAGKTPPPDQVVQEINKLLDNLKKGFHLE